MLRKFTMLVTLLLVVACGSANSLADELPLDENHPTLVMFFTEP